MLFMLSRSSVAILHEMPAFSSCLGLFILGSAGCSIADQSCKQQWIHGELREECDASETFRFWCQEAITQTEA